MSKEVKQFRDKIGLEKRSFILPVFFTNFLKEIFQQILVSSKFAENPEKIFLDLNLNSDYLLP